MSFSTHPNRRRSIVRELATMVWELICEFKYIVIGVLILLVVGFAVYWPTHTATVTICDKQATAKNGDNQYRLDTPTATYEISDSDLHLRYDSADLYRKIHTPGVYKIEYYGLRLSFFSEFKNILSATPVPNAKPTGCK